MTAATLTVALVSDVFHDGTGAARLRARLDEARASGADLAVLPELPCNPWSPATRQARDDDAEPPEGPRWRMQRDAAAGAGTALVGGAIVRNPETGVRLNTALVFGKSGGLIATYAKCHLPEEEGFWETSHYEPGVEHAAPIDGLPLRIGVQLCSDANRPEGCHILGAMGAEAIVIPRATEQRTYERWKTVFRAGAMTSGSYILSVNRPGPENGVLMGPPSGSIAVAPDGTVLLESSDPVATVTLHRAAVVRARVDYPGYLPIRAALYAEAWRRIAEQQL